ncbi:MAG: hypothetical protein ACK56I_16425, partial [bacterium]
ERHHFRTTRARTMTRSRHRTSIRVRKNLTQTIGQIYRRSKRTSQEQCRRRRYCLRMTQTENMTRSRHRMSIRMRLGLACASRWYSWRSMENSPPSTRCMTGRPRIPW